MNRYMYVCMYVAYFKEILSCFKRILRECDVKIVHQAMVGFILFFVGYGYTFDFS